MSTAIMSINAKLNGIEITFVGKPSAAAREGGQDMKKILGQAAVILMYFCIGLMIVIGMAMYGA